MTRSTVRELIPPRPIPRITASGFYTVNASIALFLLLDAHAIVTTGSKLESTISAYGLGGSRWIFITAVLLLAAGSAGFLVALIGRQLTSWRSSAAFAMTLWVVGLVGLALFPKQDWTQPVSISGSIHGAATASAFFSLPIAAILLARPWLRDRNHALHARRTLTAGVLAITSFTPLLYAIGVSVVTGTNWWDVMTLGYTERLIAAAEAATLIVIGTWSLART